jgi:hypothetical protein
VSKCLVTFDLCSSPTIQQQSTAAGWDLYNIIRATQQDAIICDILEREMYVQDDAIIYCQRYIFSWHSNDMTLRNADEGGIFYIYTHALVHAPGCI